MMNNRSKLLVSHAPFIHNGSRISDRSYLTMLAALPAVIFGVLTYGFPALGVVSLSVATAIGWELIMNRVTGRPVSIGDGSAALVGLIFAMLVPATLPWWAVVVGTFFAIVIGKQVFGGIGANPFHPALVAVAILMVSWKGLFDFNQALVDYDTGFNMAYPLWVLKNFGLDAIDVYTLPALLIGKQSGGIGATFGIGLILGGLFLMLRGIIRWEVSVSFLAGVFITALIFNFADSTRYAGPFFHLLTGYTLIGAFFLAPEDATSPVNFFPMLIYGAGAGVFTVLIRNIGAYADGVVFALLFMNAINPLLDKIRPAAIGKVA